ncbi:MAG: hypothetical protein AB8I08_38995 [Sandaracinaceae bacterium]
MSEPDGMQMCAALVDLARPARGGDPGAPLRAMTLCLEHAPELAVCLRERFVEQLRSMAMLHALVDAGVLEDRGVASTFSAALRETALPRDFSDVDARAWLPRVFRRDDWVWVTAIPRAQWAAWFACLLRPEDVDGWPHRDVATAMRALAARVAATGIDEELDGKLTFVDASRSPFLGLAPAIEAFLVDHEEGPGNAETFDRAREMLDACEALVRELRQRRAELGTSLRLTRLTRRMHQQLERLRRLLHVVRPDDGAALADALAALFVDLLEAVQDGHSLRRRLGHSLDLWAFQITEHTAAKGSKYVASSVAAYRSLLLKAMGGGAIVGVFAIFKLFLSKLSLPLAAKALVYGTNYAVCFLLIYLTGATLATKQPAITASAIAKKLDTARSRAEGLSEVASMVVLVWRSQFVSFLGNLLMAFPVAIAIAYGLEQLMGVVTADEAKARQLLFDNHPFDGPTLLYAAIAGLFLFTSGLIQGAVDNRVVYTSLRVRLAKHPRFRFLGRAQARLAEAFTKHAGALVSNIALGFMLGSTGVLGIIVGLPLDIRHIAFSSSHVGVTTLDAPHLIDVAEVLVVLLGVIGIGFVNFVVSFGLTLLVTLKSRRVSFTQGGTLMWMLLRRLVRSPAAWFFPVSREDGET